MALKGCRPRATILRLFLLATLWLHSHASALARRQISAHPVFLPRCKYDEHIIKSEDKLQKQIDLANFVFTGKVTSDIRLLDNRTIVFSVYVRRYFKNNAGLSDNQEVRVLKTLYDGEGVKCRQVLRYRYTAIFIGRKPQKLDADVQLTINPVPVTLTNLDRVTAATKDLMHKPRQHYIEEQNDPCRDKQCGFGARCVVSPDGRNASCVCPDKCPSYGDHTTSRPVCGSDGIDYRNQCELQKAACTSNTNITIKFLGKCDPCAGVECAEPEVCQLDEHRNPVCRCGDSCPLEFTPVCGSDGKTYSNECTLRQEACRARKNLHIIYRGKCSSGLMTHPDNRTSRK